MMQTPYLHHMVEEILYIILIFIRLERKTSSREQTSPSRDEKREKGEGWGIASVVSQTST